MLQTRYLRICDLLAMENFLHHDITTIRSAMMTLALVATLLIGQWAHEYRTCCYTGSYFGSSCCLSVSFAAHETRTANHRLQRRPRADVFEVVSRSRGPAEPYRYLLCNWATQN